MEQFTELLMMALPIITNVLYWVVVIAIVVHFIAAFLIISSWGSAARTIISAPTHKEVVSKKKRPMWRGVSFLFEFYNAA